MTSPPSVTSWAAAPPVRMGSASGRWVLIAAILGSGMAGIDATVVYVALPAMGRDLGGGVAILQWTVSAYTLTLASLILLGGALGDRYGRRRVFVVGVIWFAIASLLCGVATTSTLLIGARGLQGVGGALLTPGSLAMIQASFAPGDRGRAIGAWSGLGGVATAMGPLLGGWLVETASWRWVFLINAPVAVLVVMVTLRHVPETADPTLSGGIDFGGAALGVLGLGGVTYALIEAPVRGVGSSLVIAAAVLGAAALIGFVLVERRERHPMLPPGIFRSVQFSAGNAVTFAVYAALGGVFFLLSVALQTVVGFSPVAAGTALLPVTGLMLVLSARAGALAQRIGPRLPMTLGPLVCAVGVLLLLRVGRNSGYGADVLPGVVVFGLGLATLVAPLTAMVLAAADAEHAGVASGVNNAVARGAGLIAVAVLPAAVGLSGADYTDPTALTDGLHRALVICAILLVLGGLLAAATIRNGRLDVPLRRFCGVDGTPLNLRPTHATSSGTGSPAA